MGRVADTSLGAGAMRSGGDAEQMRERVPVPAVMRARELMQLLWSVGARFSKRKQSQRVSGQERGREMRKLLRAAWHAAAISMARARES
eukprot:3374188-Rhodomonas_salina.1